MMCSLVKRKYGNRNVGRDALAIRLFLYCSLDRNSQQVGKRTIPNIITASNQTGQPVLFH